MTTTAFPGAAAMAPGAALGLVHLDLSITGMTCAACVRRIEKAVRAVPGVDAASVNLVTQRAAVRHDPRAAGRDALVAAIERAGYGVVDAAPASHPAAPAARADALADAEAREARAVRRDLAIAALLAVPLLVIAMSHGAIPGTAGAAGSGTGAAAGGVGVTPAFPASRTASKSLAALFFRDLSFSRTSSGPSSSTGASAAAISSGSPFAAAARPAVGTGVDARGPTAARSGRIMQAPRERGTSRPYWPKALRIIYRAPP